ncbi:MAG: ATP-binding protein [Candidatus Heimdallarchaeota archaeon]|nr:ATP-binding protein [Candidatus Heimdallarchaeota archaeon]
MSKEQLHIGFNRKDNSNVEIPIKSLKRHFAALGSSGSGKTVLVKAIMEECIRQGIPLILIDLQGDLASLALDGDKKLVESKGVPGSYYDEINKMKQVAIWTPASSKGLTISMNPLKAPPDQLDYEDKIQAIDAVADTVASILGYNTEKGKGAEVKSYLYLLLEAIWGEGEELGNFSNFANYILNDSDFLDEASCAMLVDKDKEQLAKGMKTLTIGADSLIFNAGIPLDIEKMMTWADKGRVAVNVLYLNSLRKAEDKVNFIANASTQVYNYMLRNPSEDVQLVYVLDELAGLVPPTRNPPTKKPIQLLLKQARKYGVSLLLATQNISDVDYKSLGQVGTWALGRLMAKQDIEKVKDIIQSISPAETDAITSSITKQKTGQFMLLAPDVFSSVQQMQVRWLVTNHTTLDDAAVDKITDESGLREKFPEASLGKKKSKKSNDEESEDEIEVEEEEEEDEDEDFLQNTEMAATFVPEAKTPTELTKAFDDAPIALSAEELSVVTGEDKKKLTTNLNKLVTDKKLNSDKMDGTKIYWSIKHQMDPANNIIGPIYKIQLTFPEAKATEVMEDNLRKVLIKKLEEIKRKSVKYIPLWRIGTIDTVEEGRFKKKSREIKRFWYVNGMTGGILHINKKEEQFEFPFDNVIPEDMKTLNHKLVKINQITLASLTGAYLKPILNRNHALGVIERKLGTMINNKIMPAIIWYPVFEFNIRDKDTNKRRSGYVDGVFGFHTENNPFKDE